MTDVHTRNRTVLDPLRAVQYNWDEAALRRVLSHLVRPDAVFRLAHPFGDMVGPETFHDQALAVLKAAWPDVERRDWIVMAGDDEFGAEWVGCGGHFMGTFVGPFLGHSANGSSDPHAVSRVLPDRRRHGRRVPSALGHSRGHDAGTVPGPWPHPSDASSAFQDRRRATV